MAAVTWLFAVEEPADDVFSIPCPPVPVRPSPRRGRVHWSRRLVLGLSLNSVCTSLAAIMALIARVRG